MPLDSGTKDDIETHLANGIPEVDTKRLSGAHVFASGYDAAAGAACQAALDEYGDDPSVVHLDVDVPSLDAAAPLEVPDNTVVYLEGDITLADDTATNIIQTKDAFTQASGTSGSTLRSNAHLIGAGGTVDGNKANQTAGTDGFDQACVHIYADESSVRGVRTRNAALHGISIVGGTQDVRVVGNDCRNNGSSQIQAHFRTTGGDDGDGAVVLDLIVDENTCVGGDNTGSIRLAGCERAKVRGNTVRDHTTSADNHGIRIYQGDYPDHAVRDIVVSDNIVQNVSGAGIQVDSSAQDGTLGSHQHIVVANNNVSDQGGVGLQLLERQNLVANIVVDGNDVSEGADDGIELNNALGCAITNNMITSNAGTAVDLVNSPDDNLYDGNVARANGTDELSGTGTGSIVGDNVGL